MQRATARRFSFGDVGQLCVLHHQLPIKPNAETEIRNKTNSSMEKIQHSTIATNSINIHLASIGSGPPVLLLHGFPELWYSWRHQLLFLASKGFRAIAPDLRGFGDSDVPSSPSSYTPHHIIGDLIGVLDHLGIDQVFLVGHDWGAMMAWYFCLFRPDRVKALVNLSVYYTPRNPVISPLAGLRLVLGDDFYICRFQVSSNSCIISEIE